MKLECNTCGHAEVCVYKAQYAEYFQALEAAHKKWQEEQVAIIIERYRYLYQKYRPSEEHFDYMRSRKKGDR